MTTVALNYEELILEGITGAGGLPEDIEHVRQEWLTELGTKAANIGAKKRMKFPSWMVEPMDDVEKALKQGHYTDHYGFITNKTVKLPKAEGKKRLYVVPFYRNIGEKEYATLLAEHNLKPCKNGPSYLAGLMAQVPESEMPEELKGKYIVAAEPDNKNSVFQDECGFRCFLFVLRHGGAHRLLGLAFIDFGDWGGFWAFLAEET